MNFYEKLPRNSKKKSNFTKILPFVAELFHMDGHEDEVLEKGLKAISEGLNRVTYT